MYREDKCFLQLVLCYTILYLLSVLNVGPTQSVLAQAKTVISNLYILMVIPKKFLFQNDKMTFIRFAASITRIILLSSLCFDIKQSAYA